jgi:hypothetical protein
MNNTLLYNYVGESRFGLNIPPFTLKIYITNFENTESLIIEKKVDRFEDLPKNIMDVLDKSNHFKNYVQNVSIYFFLHFQVELYNNIEKIHNEFFSKQLKDFIF